MRIKFTIQRINPFDDYEKTARKEIKTLSNEKGVNLELISILLGFKNYNKSFKSITHFEFFKKIKSRVGKLHRQQLCTFS